MKEKSSFWRVFKVVLLIAVVLVVIGEIYLVMILKDYEAAQPKYVAEDTFNTYFKNFDADSYAEKCSMGEGYASPEDVAKVLHDITDGKEIKYYRVSNGMEKSFKYIVKADDVKFASFKLVEDTEAVSKFTAYKADDFEVFVNAGETVNIEAPEGYKVYLNGNELGEEKISEKDIKTDDSTHLPENVKGILYNRYTVSGILGDPEVKVTDGKGAEATVEKLKNGNFKAGVIYDESLKKQYNDWILKGMKRYAEYMQHSSNNPVTFGEISVYFDPSSDLYEDIKTEENMFVWDYDSVEYENDETSCYTVYDENTFSCRTTFVQILHKTGEQDYKDHLDLTLYLRKVGDDYLIYDMAQN